MNHNSELESAIEQVQGKGFDIVYELASSLIEKVGDKKEGMEFAEALRYSLNELHIWDRDKRQGYAKVAGVFFGRRGGRKRAAANSRQQALPKKKKTVTGTVRMAANGQYEAVF